MRTKLWMFDMVIVDLEDRDILVKLIPRISLTEITVQFRAPENVLDASVHELRFYAETLATDRVLDLACFLDQP